jgi:hypothetical protein
MPTGMTCTTVSLQRKFARAWDRTVQNLTWIVGSIKINKWEAAHIPNKTWPIVQEPGQYIAVLDVFHHLHCLVRHFAHLLSPPQLTLVNRI